MKDQTVTEVPAPTPDKKDGPLWTAAVVLTTLIALVFLASTLWVWQAVPVSAQDLKDASWLYGYQQVAYFSITSLALGLAMTFVGVGVGLVKKQGLVVAQGLLLGALVTVAGAPSMNFIAAADGGSAKVGCFAWETKQCRTMLGLAGADSLPSMYAPREQADRTGEVYTPEYVKQIDAPRESAELFLPDVSAIAMMPWIAAHTDVLNAKLKAQREEVARRRAADAQTLRH